MPRNMSFMLTEGQIRDRSKTVTRRVGWRFLKPGQVLNACRKCMGLRKGEKVEVICQIRVVSVRREPLDYIRFEMEGTKSEGFPLWSSRKFIDFFCETHRCGGDEQVTRIEFEYLEAEDE